jgi:hypothetical protein
MALKPVLGQNHQGAAGSPAAEKEYPAEPGTVWTAAKAAVPCFAQRRCLLNFAPFVSVRNGTGIGRSDGFAFVEFWKDQRLARLQRISIGQSRSPPVGSNHSNLPSAPLILPILFWTFGMRFGASRLSHVPTDIGFRKRKDRALVCTNSATA